MSSNDMWRNWWRQTISNSISQDILSQIFDGIQSDTMLQNQLHKIYNCFLTHQYKNVFGVLKITVLLRQFFWVPTTYVLDEKIWKIIFKYTLLSGGLWFTLKFINWNAL